MGIDLCVCVCFSFAQSNRECIRLEIKSVNPSFVISAPPDINPVDHRQQQQQRYSFIFFLYLLPLREPYTLLRVNVE